jgi:hypothetical protein
MHRSSIIPSQAKHTGRKLSKQSNLCWWYLCTDMAIHINNYGQSYELCNLHIGTLRGLNSHGLEEIQATG